MTADTWERIEDADDEATAVIARVAEGTGATGAEWAWAHEWLDLTAGQKAGRLEREAGR